MFCPVLSASLYLTSQNAAPVGCGTAAAKLNKIENGVGEIISNLVSVCVLEEKSVIALLGHFHTEG